MLTCSGKPVEIIKAETFEEVCDCLQVNDTELPTFQDIMVVDKARVLVQLIMMYIVKSGLNYLVI